MRLVQRTILFLFLLAVSGVLAGWAVWQITAALEARRSHATPAEIAPLPAPEVAVIAVSPGPVAVQGVGWGRVTAAAEAVVRTEAGGRVRARAPGLAEGRRVSRGELLVELDPTDAETALRRARIRRREAEAELRAARASLALARQTVEAVEEQLAIRRKALERQRALSGRGVGSDQAIEAAELALARARETVIAARRALAEAMQRQARAESALERARVDEDEAARRLADTRLRAPITGRLVALEPLAPGMRIPAGAEVARIADTDSLEVRFRLPAARVARLLDEDGALRPLAVHVSASGAGGAEAVATASGRLHGTLAQAPEDGAGRVLVARLDAARGLLPGDFVAVRVAEPPYPHAARIPAAAVGPDDRVLVVGEGNRLEARHVRILRREGTTLVIAAEGLAGGTIVARPSPSLLPGMIVRPVPAAPPGAGRSAGKGVGVPRGAAVSPGADEGGAMVRLGPRQKAALLRALEADETLTEAERMRLRRQLEAPAVPTSVLRRLMSPAGASGG